MAYYRESQIKQRGALLTESKRQAMKSAVPTARVFVSHSHKDADLIKGLADLIADEGVQLYVDWQDSTMPTTVSPETARQLKAKIKENTKFILIASNNALESAWVPWELGVGDVEKGMDNVTIWPVLPDYGNWRGTEYIGIYSTIQVAQGGGPGVFAPGATSGITLAGWLKQ